MAHLGVTRSGAADRRSHTLANRLVANPHDRATIEVTFGGFSARVRGGERRHCRHRRRCRPVCQWCSVWHQQHSLRGTTARSSHWAPRTPGCAATSQWRGGIAGAEPVLGSRSYDVMSDRPAAAPARRRADRRRAHRDFPELDQAPVAAIAHDLLELMVVPGPAMTGSSTRMPWYTPSGWSPTAATGWACEPGRPLQHRSPGPSPAVQRRGHPGANSGAAERIPGDPGSGSSGHGRLSGDRCGRRSGHQRGQIRPGQHVRMHWARPRSPFGA